MGNADALSRLPLNEKNDIELQNIHSFSESVPIDVTIITVETANDQILSKVCKYTSTRWPVEVEAPLKPL